MIDRLNSIEDKNEALEQFAFLLMPDSNTMSDTSRFFQTEGRKILTASLIAFYHQQLDFIEICEKIVFSSWKELLPILTIQTIKKLFNILILFMEHQNKILPDVNRLVIVF